MLLAGITYGLLALIGLGSALLIPPDSRAIEVQDKHKLTFQGQHSDELELDNTIKKRHRVPVVLGVMSRCPDAELCESVFDKVLPRVDHLVDLSMAYIGSLNESSTPYGVDCKHGPHECDGNVQQLCVQNSVHKTKDWWNFIQCQNFENLDRVGDLSLAKQCAKVIHRSWDDDFSSCYTGPRGKKLLQASVQRAQALNITTSCSILVNGRLTCIHDNGAWSDCPEGHEVDDFVRVIKREYDAIN